MCVCNLSNAWQKCHLVVRKGCGSWEEAKVRLWQVTRLRQRGGLGGGAPWIQMESMVRTSPRFCQ